MTLGQVNPLLAPCGLLGLHTVELAVPSVSLDCPYLYGFHDPRSG